MDPTCKRCGDSYCCRDGQEPTDVCDGCAHDIAAKAIAFAEAYDAEAATLHHEVKLGDAQNAAMIAVVRAARLPIIPE